MHGFEITSEAFDAAYKLDSGHVVVDDDVCCIACGNEFETGQQALDVRTPEFGERAMATIHLRCYQGEEVIT